uniref:Uncharacterized protein n=1 Tax=Rhizophora mucronata TaxID=61149 RepID=A0A2P2Q662_RHIMU
MKQSNPANHFSDHPFIYSI